MLALTFSLSAILFSACGDDSSQSSSTPPQPPVSNTYVVSFETNGGSAVQAVEVNKNATLDLNEYTTTKENSYFYGWCFDEALTNRASAVITVTDNVTLYAEWGADELYWLNFETGNGSDVESVQYAPNAYLAAPEEPTRTNYSFGGWYKDEACTKEFSFLGAQMPRKNLTVYAKWNSLNGIMFETNGGSQVQSVFGDYGEPVPAIADPVKENYIFEGWYEDKNLTVPYELVTIPQNVITIYAKWHEQAKDVAITLHLNSGFAEATPVTVYADEGETLNADATVASFQDAIHEAVVSSGLYLGSESDFDEKALYNFSAWAFDELGQNRFSGKVPHETAIDLYAIWSRSATYCTVTFVEEETTYFLKKNTAVPASVIDPIVETAESKYSTMGCLVDGFYTVGGNRYFKNDLVAMDMQLTPYVASANLVFEYATMVNNKGVNTKGYVLKGYDESVAESYKQKDGLLLLIPQYFNDNTHGQLPVIWIADNAFADYPVNEISLYDNVFGFGSQAFKNTALKSISLPSSLYYLGDNVFSNSLLLETVIFNSNVTQIGATVFQNTPYESNMPTDKSGFKYFDTARTIVYGYTGSAETVTTPGGAVTIAGHAFKNNTTIKTLTVHNDTRYISDYAFEGSAVEKVTLGKAFATMGVGIFKNCTRLTTVNFVSAYNLSLTGESMFEGCVSLKEINLSTLQNLQSIGKRSFYGCSSLERLSVANSLTKVEESAFENCTSLVSADFGTSDFSKLTSLGDKAFKGCTSLKRIIFRGTLINNQIVQLGTEVLTNAGSAKTPIIFVKDTWVDNWSVDDDFKTTSYVEIYQRKLANTEYKNIVIRAIDSNPPTLTVNGVLELSKANTASISAFDIATALTSMGVYTVSDDDSAASDCTVYVSGVVMEMGTNDVSIQGSNGKYDLSRVGTYRVTLVAEDEFGNTAEEKITVFVRE